MVKKRSKPLIKDQFVKNVKQSESYISMGLGLLVVLVIGVMIFNFVKARRTNKLTLPGIHTQTEEEQINQPEKTAQIGVPTTYTVVEGDTLWSIAEKYYHSGFNWTTLVSTNNITDPNLLGAGTQLTIPQLERKELKEDTYTVAKDDTLWDIAIRLYNDGYQWSKVAKENNLVNPDLIYPGNIFRIPK